MSSSADTGVVPPAAQAVAALHPDHADVAIKQVQGGVVAAMGAGQPRTTAGVCLGVERHLIASRVSGTVLAGTPKSPAVIPGVIYR
jgi:hypothetical protein